MLESQRWIRRHWSRLQWGQFLGICADQLALALIGVGSFILLVKLFVPGLWPHALWLFLGLLLVPFLTWRKLNSRRFTNN